MIDFAETLLAFVLASKGEAARVLEQDFLEGLKPRIGLACKLVDEQKLAGLEIDWGEPSGAVSMATMPSSSEGKQFYISWLKDRYGYNIARLNEAYGLESTSFSDLAESDFKRVDRNRTAVREDDRLFSLDLAATLQQKVSEMFQACAPGRKTAWKRNRT